METELLIDFYITLKKSPDEKEHGHGPPHGRHGNDQDGYPCGHRYGVGNAEKGVYHSHRVFAPPEENPQGCRNDDARHPTDQNDPKRG